MGVDAPGNGEKNSRGLPRVRPVAPREAFPPGEAHLPRLGGISQRRAEALILKGGLGVRSVSKLVRNHHGVSKIHTKIGGFVESEIRAL